MKFFHTVHDLDEIVVERLLVVIVLVFALELSLDWVREVLELLIEELNEVFLELIAFQLEPLDERNATCRVLCLVKASKNSRAVFSWLSSL